MIQAEHLSMWYGRTRALADASFQVREGEVLGLVGPNGAGKSTTLKILTTYLQPTEGRVLVDGVDAAEDSMAVRRRIGYLPETTPLYVDMTVAEYLDFCGRARRLGGRSLAERTDGVVDACGLAPVFHRPIAHLSKGFRQRTGLAQALLHDPDILILDEPTSGLDPMQILGIRRLIHDLAESKTILFSTHILQEISAVSDRVMIINEGRIIAEGTPDELVQRAMGDDRLSVEVAAPAAEVRSVLAALPGVAGVEEAEPVLPEAAHVLVRHAFGNAEVPAAVERTVRESGWPLHRLAPDRFTLEQIFIALIGGASAAEDAAEPPARAAAAAEGGEA